MIPHTLVLKAGLVVYRADYRLAACCQQLSDPGQRGSPLGLCKRSSSIASLPDRTPQRHQCELEVKFPDIVTR